MIKPNLDTQHGISRRAFLGGLGAAGIGVAAAGTIGLATANADAATGDGTGLIPFFGPHQAGIATPTPDRLHIAAFDLTTNSVGDVKTLMQMWSRAAALMTQDRPVGAVDGTNNLPPGDTGEQIDRAPSRLTITFGFGPDLFTKDGKDRYGLAKFKPAGFAQVPVFSTDHLDPAISAGDIVVQACGDDATVLFHAIHNLTRMARGVAVLRWSQTGFGKNTLTTKPADTGRNLMGNKDGSDNIDTTDPALMTQSVWAAASDGAAWMAGGSYMVGRKILMLLENWDRSGLDDQEATIGRYKASGAPLGGVNEHDTPNFTATDATGNLVIPANAHTRMAHPDNNNGIHILRRGYSYTNGVDATSGEIDAGLFFIAYMRDINKQFVPLQTHLATIDALNQYIKHTSSAVFAMPPGATANSYVGATLFGN